MFNIRTYNAISDIIFNTLKADEYRVSDSLDEYDGILVRSAELSDVAFPEQLVAIARAGAGTNNVPVAKCSEAGICVFNTPGANANAVKELVLCAMLLSCRKVVSGIEWVKEAKASGETGIEKLAEKAKKNFVGPELYGKKLGVIGLGAIGGLVANAAALGFGMKVLGYDPYMNVEAALHLTRAVQLTNDINEIFSTCDYITLHLPLLDSTKGMIGEAAFNKMKKGVILINMARDLLVDEGAVVAAIEAGKVRRYVSDFPNPTVAGKKGCITTPHLGASTEESEINCAKMAVDELRDYLENGNIRNSVNYPNCDMGVCTAGSRICIFHKNQPSMITQFTQILGASDVNIAGMANKSKKEVAYTLIDFDSPADKELIKKLAEVKDVYRVRVIK